MCVLGVGVHSLTIHDRASLTIHDRASLQNTPVYSPAFPPDPDNRLEVLGPRALFCLVQACGLAFTLWKLNGMGLLPTHVSDWVTSTPVAPFRERALTPL